MEFQPEIIRLILGHLEDVEDLKKCLLTSEKIRDIIIKSPELMRRLTLILMHDTWKQKMPFIDKYAFFIRALKLDDIGFENHEEYLKLLRQTVNLERLIIDDCYITSERETDNDDAEQENEDGEERPAQNEVPPEQNMELEENGAAAQEDHEHMEVQDNANEADAMNAIEEENSPNNNNNNENVNVEQNGEIQPDVAAADVVDAPPNANNEESNETKEAVKSEEIEPPLNLKHLTYLHLESSTISETIIKSLPECNTLKFLKLTFYYQEPITTFTDFLCRQDDLEDLEVQGWSEMVWKCLFKDDIRDKTKFRLKKFSLECEMSYNANFSHFFRSQAEHIRELELSCYNINFHYYRMIFNHFHNLTKLNIPTDWFLTDARVNAIKDCRIESLRELELIGANDDLITFKTILNIFPNIEVLKCENLQNFSMYGILENLKNLKTIRSENFRCETMLFVKVPSLISLETGFLYPFAMDFLWQNLSLSCPNLENILIEDIGHFKLNESVKTEFAIIIKNLKHFKSIKTCKILCTPQENTVNGDHDVNENEVLQEQAFYKVDIKVEDKSIKISQYFAQHCTEEVQTLRETFKECDITEA
jgi:hypothetical protein